MIARNSKLGLRCQQQFIPSDRLGNVELAVSTRYLRMYGTNMNYLKCT